MALRNRVQLITYHDSLGGSLPSLRAALGGPLAGLFSGVHILPFYPSSGDRGFAPITYRQVEPRFGTWADIRHIAEHWDVAADVMVNHLSRQSPEFQDFCRMGRRSEHADLFLTPDKVWPDGQPPAGDLARIVLRRSEPPFSEVRIESTGEIERVWTTFGAPGRSEQIDLDVQAPSTRALLADLVRFLGGQGIRLLRLDAVGYVIKRSGTSCFFVEPEIYQFLEWMQEVAHTAGMEIVPEVHAEPAIQARLAAHGFWVYDFVLPLLILHTLRGAARSGARLAAYLAACPRRQFTMLDCHDGIPVRPDLDGLLSVPDAREIVDRLLARGANLSRLLSPDGQPIEFDAHQINCTYYSALDADDDAYLAARAIQFFAPGIPQVYYVGLLAGENDHAAVASTGEGRAINRHDYTPAEIEQALGRPAVRRLLRLIRFRNSYPAFGGAFQVHEAGERTLVLSWQQGRFACSLQVDLAAAHSVIAYRNRRGREVKYRV